MKDGKGENGVAAAMPSPELLCRAVEELRAVCRDAWQEGLLSGCNGNASLRLEASGGCAGLLCMTRTGAAKGRLTPADLCLMDAATGACLANGPASSEAAVHLALYATRPECGAVLHTHPRRLLALSLVLRERGEGAKGLLRLPLFEADVWRTRLAVAPALAPGTRELAHAVARAAATLPETAVNAAGGAVWMEGHGLCAFAPSLGAALTMSEELEHLAAVQLLALGVES
ncbi:MAG: class II aldolase/adducin family protein [Desulfovibrio sp.]|uniref:class II aldolase/adducin family protein n=1 Tax=Desulfovibrio sp. TaxID=885 RepID=UPI001A69C270|nr:class II aldolase/adducin family protein [Desulfovibrio sp.]MBD5417697.1 class II aldolase/adducin family protein [Desulfovibrio sp.]